MYDQKRFGFGGRATPLYGLYMYVRPQRVWEAVPSEILENISHYCVISLANFRIWFSAVLVINRVSILANFGHFGNKSGIVFAL